MIYRSLSNQCGFGLLSMVFVILTLTIAGVVIVTLLSPSAFTRQEHETVVKAGILRAAIQSYQFSHGGVNGTRPPALSNLVSTDGTPCTMDNTPTSSTYLYLQGWCGPYVDQVFAQNPADYQTDGWGTAFGYNAGTGVITSCGADKVCGGADDLTFAP